MRFFPFVNKLIKKQANKGFEAILIVKNKETNTNFHKAMNYARKALSYGRKALSYERKAMLCW